MTTPVQNKSIGATSAAIDLIKENNKVLDGGPKFSEALAKQAEAAARKTEAKEVKTITAKPILKFSNHALERMNTRGIHFTPEQITKIEQGMQKVSSKGAKESLFLTDDSALIVSLKDSTVVTVMDKSMLRENVFTNIDATVFV